MLSGRGRPRSGVGFDDARMQRRASGRLPGSRRRAFCPVKRKRWSHDRDVLERIKTALRPFGLYRAARFGWHFATDGVFRRDHLLLWRRPSNLYQHRSITLPDRYPGIFELLREKLAGVKHPRLLSFGCAMGDEVFSLRSYFPTAEIKGIDINPANIAECRRRLARNGGDDKLSFEIGSSAANERGESYDAVLCMAVFVRWQLKRDRDVATCEPHLRFADFARATAEFAACVAPGGYLVIRHAMFRFADTPAAREFSCVVTLPQPKEFFPCFGPDNRRLPDTDTEAVVFQKRLRAHA